MFVGRTIIRFAALIKGTLKFAGAVFAAAHNCGDALGFFFCCIMDIGITNWKDGAGRCPVCFVAWPEFKTWLNLKPFAWRLGVRWDNAEY